jgi:Bacterial TSP3 repeat
VRPPNINRQNVDLFRRTSRWARLTLQVLGLLLLSLTTASSATLTIQTNPSGTTPDLLSYNTGHFYPGSNTREWWHYSGVTGARVFVAPSEIEATDDIGGRGDGVLTQTDFLNRKAALRASPLNTNYINWSYFTNRYESHTLVGANKIRVNYAFSQLRQLNIEITVNITASQSFLTITNSNDWAGKWELWQHYYAQGFYLAREFDVKRYQMYNEPDHPNANGLTQADFLQRLQLASDAIQSAIADVNAMYGKSLTPIIMAPVTAGSTYVGWGDLVVTNRHKNFLGQTDANFWLINKFDYHQYNATAAGFGSTATSLRNSINTAMAGETPFPLTISEFNVHTVATFDGMPETLDSPSKYLRFGAIVVNLVKNSQRELYAFKFSQTDGDVGDNYPIRKNGMHYVDNDNPPFNIGGITKAGEVWRLFNKGFAPGRQQKSFVAGSGMSNLEIRASYDAVTGRYYVFSANDSSTSTPLTIDVSALNIQDNNRVIIEEVSESAYGSVTHYTRVLSGQVTTFTQPASSVWLVTIPTKPQQFVSPTVPTIVVSPSDDATVKDGGNKLVNYGTQTSLIVRNDPADAANRSAAFIKFRLPKIYLPDVQLAVLSVQASTLTSNVTAQAHVYGINNDNWSQATVNWATAPNLRQNIAAGNLIGNNVISGLGDSAFLQGQLVCSSTNPTEVQIDVTDFIRSQTNYDASFLISQDPRWNVTLPSLVAGDTQPDGIQIVSLESDGNVSGPRLKLVRLKDTDNDGISDEAETMVFGTAPANPDTDGDGVNDGDEVFAGTNPLDPKSNLRVLSVARIPDVGFKLDWTAATNRSYRVYRATNLLSQTWEQLYFGRGTNATMSITDPLTDTQLPTRPASFYRLSVEP